MPTPPEVRAIVWYHLEQEHDRRPRVSDIAKALGTTERRLRRDWSKTGHESLRRQIMLGCLSHGVWQIYAKGEKAIAAARMAGFHSYWNFNRDLKRCCRCTAKDCRQQFPFKFDLADTVEKVEALRVNVRSGRAQGA